MPTNAVLSCILNGIVFIALGACNIVSSSSYSTPESDSSEATKTGCSVKSEPPKSNLMLLTDDQLSEAQSQALILGDILATEMHATLSHTLGSATAAVLANGATNELEASIGGLEIPHDNLHASLQNIMPSMIKGAMMSISDPCAALSEYDHRISAGQGIVASAAATLKNRTGDMGSEQRFGLVGSIAKSGIEVLPEAGMAGDRADHSVASLTLTAVETLPDAGVSPKELVSAARWVASSAVEALAAEGFETSAMGDLSGKVVGSSIHGLNSAGINSAELVASGAIGEIIAGAIASLKVSDNGNNTIGAIGSIAGAAVGVLTQVGITSNELRESALKTVLVSSLSEAQKLASANNSFMAEAMSAIAQKSVTALAATGASSGEISTSISIVVSTGISRLADSGINDAMAISKMASKLIEGAMAGAAILVEAGSIATESAILIASEVSTTAIDEIKKLQEVGVMDASAKDQFASQIASNIASGLQKGGADASVVSSAEISAATSSSAADQVIASASSTLGTVADPVFSVVSGTYNAVVSVEISSATAGAGIRYTTDGSAPTTSTGSIYSGSALTVSSTSTIRAIAFKADWQSSNIVTATYTINLPPPSLFGSPTPFTVGSETWFIAAGDLNGDNKNDLAISQYGPQKVSFLLNDGSGGFGHLQSMNNYPNSLNATGTSYSEVVLVEDLNGDGKRDVLWGTWEHNRVFRLINNTTAQSATLTWNNNQPAAWNPDISGPQGVAFGDADGDGYKDIWITEGNGNRLLVYLNYTGAVNGSYSRYNTLFSFNSGTAIYSGNTHAGTIQIADLNADGKPDVVAGGQWHPRISVLFNTTASVGSPNFQIAYQLNSGSAPLSCQMHQIFSLGDINGDTRPDIIAVCPTAAEDKVLVLSNTTAAGSASGNFTSSSFNVGYNLSSVSTGDIDGDGKLDIVTVGTRQLQDSNHSPIAKVFIGDGAGNFNSGVEFELGESLNSSTQYLNMVLSDFNGDGDLDLAVSLYNIGKVVVLLNTATP